MKKTTVYLDDDLLLEVKAIARRESRSEADVIRAGVSSYVLTKKPGLPSFVGMVSDGSFDAAEDEAYLAEHLKPDW